MTVEISTRIQDLMHNDKLPKHIAIIMDGNGRWAKKRGMPRVAGHREGVKSVRKVVEACSEMGIKVLTLYTFSVQNWRRPKEEISALMKLLLSTIRREQKDMMKNNIRLITIGNVNVIPDDTRKALLEVIGATASNTGLTLNLALNYGGREELIHAFHRLACDVREGRAGTDINEETVASYLYTKSLPDPDLLIRTSGEFRLSNFLLWQLAYTEIYITDVLWPDFRKVELCDAVESYLRRERRYGKVSEQLPE